MARTFDVFPFFNELDLLEIRLHHLDSYVDKFVITEATHTHAGNPKPLYFKENRSLFRKFENKIVHHVVDGFPQRLTTFERDWFQRDQVKEVLDSLMQDDDILLYGDVDEIPSHSGLIESLDNLRNGGRFNHLAQDLFYYYLNLEETSGTLMSSMGEFPNVRPRKWLGSTVSSWAYSKNYSPTNLRDRSHVAISDRVSNGGFHFSYVGGPIPTSADIRVRTKLNESAHQELNGWRTNSFLKGRLAKGKDIFGRRGARFAKRSELSYLPPFVLENLEKFESLIQR